MDNAVVTDTTKKAESTSKTQKGDYKDLKATYTDLVDLYHKTNFLKFRFIPYQRNDADNVRLFCYALNNKYGDESDDTKFRIGTFIISEDGKGEDPSTLSGAILKYPELSLTEKQMDQIFKMDPSTCLNLDLTAVVKKDTDGNDFHTYEVFKVGNDSKIYFNPSPPGKKKN